MRHAELAMTGELLNRSRRCTTHRQMRTESVTQDVHAVLRQLRSTRRALGGVPRELLFDQMKTVITRDLRVEGGTLIHNLEFLRFATHWGFTPRACRPYRAQTKGKVQRPVGYVRGNFVYGRTFLHDADLDHQRQHWLDQIANVRVHGTTGEPPQLRFDRDERGELQPLASRRYTSLVLDQASALPTPRPAPRPIVEVEKRSATDLSRPAHARCTRSPRCDAAGRRWGNADRARSDRAAPLRADSTTQ